MIALTVTSPPEPIVVDVVSDGPQWWEIVGALAPFAVLLAAVLAAAMTFVTLRQRATADRAALEQKRRADDRAEWWRTGRMTMTGTARTRQTQSVPVRYRRPEDTQRVTAAKARLRVALDEQLGRSTPQSVKDLAARKG